MTNPADIKKILDNPDKSDLSETVDEPVAARLGKPADDEEE